MIGSECWFSREVRYSAALMRYLSTRTQSCYCAPMICYSVPIDLRFRAQSFLIDGEAVIARDDGTPDFHALRGRRRGHEAVLYAFDLIEHDGNDLRDLPLIERKWRLFKLIGRTKRRAIRFNEHLTGDGPTVFRHVCNMGLEGIVSKRTDAPYRSGRSRAWLKTKNPASAAVRREREAEWR
jgi:bifunctional non-homologous end joining protein LigD